ncbi:uncharacterized protein LOC114350126 [Ostrinia furnacalis]|uniref:uncharacterized protein LOC114350126 n=1 Tax=Ostrinia furnacalis TaxID=93504 RepID=UPI001038E975|nr:uncharacterized protein LOC114350126 [Ostrinia furnacalis]
MKFSAFLMVVMAVLAMLFGAGHGNPEPKVPVRQIGKAVKTGFGIASAAGTARDVYDRIRNRG